MIGRSGTTLVEVLVAIFITALGLLGLLALFPLGAISMAQAIKDSRCAQAAANAFALAEAANIRNDPHVIGQDLGADVFVDGNIGGTRPPADPNGPSYPVYVDPLGLLGGMGPYLGSGSAVHPGSASPSIPRQNIGFLAHPATAAQGIACPTSGFLFWMISTSLRMALTRDWPARPRFFPIARRLEFSNVRAVTPGRIC